MSISFSLLRFSHNRIIPRSLDHALISSKVTTLHHKTANMVQNAEYWSEVQVPKEQMAQVLYKHGGSESGGAGKR